MIQPPTRDRDAVRIARHVLRRNLKDVARDLGVPLPRLSRFENGHLGLSPRLRKAYLESVFVDFLRS